MTASPGTLTDLVAAMATAMGAVEGLRPSSFHPQAWADGGPSTRTWSIYVPRTEITDARRRLQSQPASEPGMQARSTVLVRVRVRVRDAGAGAQDEGLALEQLVLAALATTRAPGLGPLALTGVDRAPLMIGDSAAWDEITFAFDVTHLYGRA